MAYDSMPCNNLVTCFSWEGLVLTMINILSSSCAAISFYMIVTDNKLFAEWFNVPHLIICCLCIPFLQCSPMVESTDLVCLSILKFCTDSLRSWKQQFANKNQQDSSLNQPTMINSKPTTKVDLALFINHWTSVSSKVTDLNASKYYTRPNLT